MKADIFDEMTKAIATATTRRQAVRRIAGVLGLGTLGGGTLAALSPGIALAGGGNSNAAHFCRANFAPGPDRGQCVAAAAQGGGLYYACGGGTQSVCCPTNSSGQCTSYSSATCCSSGQACMNGTCVATCPAGTVMLSNGTCAKFCANNSQCCGGICLGDIDYSENYCATSTSGIPCSSSDIECGSGTYCSLYNTCASAIVC